MKTALVVIVCLAAGGVVGYAVAAAVERYLARPWAGYR